jgi:hypothetical protein
MKLSTLKTLVALPLVLSSSLTFADTFADFSTATLTGNAFTLPDGSGAALYASAPAFGTDAFASTIVEAVTNATSFDYSFTSLGSIGTTSAWYELGAGPLIALSDTTATDGATVNLGGFTGSITFGASATGSDIASSLVVGNLNMAPVPEPEEYALMLSGLTVLAVRLRQRKAGAAAAAMQLA